MFYTVEYICSISSRELLDLVTLRHSIFLLNPSTVPCIGKENGFTLS